MSIYNYCSQLAKCSLDLAKSVYTGRSAEECAICYSDNLYERGGFAHHPGASLGHMSYHRDCLARWFESMRANSHAPLEEDTCPARCHGNYWEDSLITDATNWPGLLQRIKRVFDDNVPAILQFFEDVDRLIPADFQGPL